MSATPPRIAQGESYIGRSVVRPQTARLLAGRGVFTDDLKLPRMTHVAFVRSPHAHARILSVDATAARALPGVVAVVTGEELARVCDGWVGTLAHFQGMKSATQHALAVGKASWQGEPVVAVDLDPAPVQGLQQGALPVHEPLLEELFTRARRQLTFSSDP
ncbi:MAG: hypothetical protein AAB328_14030, partial [candidate division NC10 bacterium]